MISTAAARLLALVSLAASSCLSSEEAALDPGATPPGPVGSTPGESAAPSEPGVAPQEPARVVVTPAATAAPRFGPPVAADAPRFDRVAASAEASPSTTLLQTTDGTIFVATGPAIAKLGADGSLEQQPSWTRGIADPRGDLDGITAGYYWWRAIAMGGTWPEGAYLVLAPESGGRGDTSPNETYRRSNGIWIATKTGARLFDWHVDAFGPWKDGSLLALRAFQPRYASVDEAGEAPPGEVVTAARAIAKEKRLIVIRGEPKAPGFGERDVRAFASLASGEIYAAMGGGPSVTMLHHDDMTSSERTFALPVEGTVSAYEIEVVATGDDRVWVFGASSDAADRARGYVARFDGRQWREVKTPCVAAARSGSIDDEGHAYFVCEVQRDENKTEAALLRARGDRVEELPTGVWVDTAIARSARDIWVLGSHESAGNVLLHTGTIANEVHTLAGQSEAGLLVYEWAEPRPLGSPCPGVWLPLAEGADREAIAKQLESLEGARGFPEVYEARVQGTVAWGITIRGLDDRELVAATKRVMKLLGASVGTPTCNQRPSTNPDP
jgi:hypothetical protein